MEQDIFNTFHDISWFRYIDDIFFAIHNDTLSSEFLLQHINNKHDLIKFTLEKPICNVLNFLDLKISFSNNIFDFCLFFKPTHSGCILPFSSHTPCNIKKAVVLGEIHRAIHRSSNNNNILISLEMIFARFLHNDYSIQYIIKCLSIYIRKNFTNPTERTRFDKCIFIKTPYFDENYYHRFNRILTKHNLHNHVKFYYNSFNMQSVFNPPKEVFLCNPECLICKITDKNNTCFSKYIVYRVDCQICHLKYIGQTSRLLKHRINEHLTKANSAIYIHHRETHADTNIFNIFKVFVLHNNIVNEKKRLYIESLYI